MHKPSLPLLVAFLACAAAPALAQAPDSLIAASYGGESRFRVNIDGGTTIVGALGSTIPVEGPGVRLMWYPGKAAFRVGEATGTVWDESQTGSHSFASGLGSRASGDYATALGLRAVAAQTTSFAAGEDVTASGAASVALGYHAHTNARMGSFVFADRSTVDTLRAGVNHSANWRTSGGFRIFTASNLSTGVTIQSGASVSNWGQSSAVISTSTGALLTTGGVWQNASDVNRKYNFEPVSGEDVLTRLRDLPIQTWTYLVEPEEVRHLGPTSQDFKAAFGLGQDDLSIGTVDADGVALAAAQALDRRTLDQADEIREQAERIDALERQNAELIARLETLERHLQLETAVR